MDADLADQIVYVVLMRILGVIGIVGNLVILSVLLRKTLRESSYVYLTAMTSCDVVVNVLAIGIGFVRCHQCELSYQEEFIGGIFEIFVFLPVVNMAATASLWTVLAMAIERFIFVAYPLKGKIYCRPGKAKRFILVICVVSLIVNMPRFFLYQVDIPIPTVEAICAGDVSRNGTDFVQLLCADVNSTVTFGNKSVSSDVIVNCCGSGSNWSSVHRVSTEEESFHGVWQEVPSTKFVVSDEDYYLAVCIWEGLTFLALVYFNLRLVMLLRRNSRQRRSFVASFRNETFSAIQSGEEFRLTLTLVAIIATAVSTDTFTLLASEPVGRFMFGASFKETPKYRVILLVSNLAVVSNSTFNFIAYAIFNSRIKEAFQQMYCSAQAPWKVAASSLSTRYFARTTATESNI